MSQEWFHLRDFSGFQYRTMSETLRLSRLLQGKPTGQHHYINEALMIDHVLFGEHLRRDRDTLSCDELRYVIDAEQYNCFSLFRGMDYGERKAALLEHVKRQEGRE
ncbi:hypothetical protein HCU01_01310 [Halomonas cupida]|uniref:Uncharacterized protein n=1 Tax=Halomonas cupida TaxID=44933 RepID=A0A1M7B0W7_9GAMM|nr:hypothetical protein [Halomonas cupida]GEN22182.1 hypothetical protein HCU01_01310 [Halomonas cupida]SHL48658.1 hypothetical protein SAMN05660971_00718 [Halomonas cupida]